MAPHPSLWFNSLGMLQPSEVEQTEPVSSRPQPKLNPPSAVTSLPWRQMFSCQWVEFLVKRRSSDWASGWDQQKWSWWSYRASLHVLTGYGSDPLGTAELYAFLLGAGNDVSTVSTCLSNLCTLGWSFATTPAHRRLSNVWLRLYHAYHRGRHSWFDLRYWQPQSLEDLPLEYIRRWFRISD
ncbi:MAG: hypothetical protein F6K30_20865 [Cyanothece sp. SIO2G6]|nr:hypothetical protein [Cyanothece sp. SIO2G6]